jgi:hypothetical protein
MRLSRPFFQLPVLLDVARLQAEVAALPQEAWAPHPDRVAGNSAVRLITAGGEETDGHHGDMQPTPWLAAMPYMRQALAGFGVVWSRSRLMRLAPGVGVPEHADINHHWHTRVRLHIPVFTTPKVRFHCDGEAVHMGEGEAWVFDNWRSHHVENGADISRIHLVADTSGTAAFWRFACAPPPPRDQWPRVNCVPGLDARLLTERDQRRPVMGAAEVQLLVDDLRADLQAPGDAQDRVVQFSRILADFICDWRQLCALHGTDGEGLADFARLIAAVREACAVLSPGMVMASNGASARLVLEKRVLEHLIVSGRVS